MGDWQIERLTEHRLGEAWPLIRLSYPAMSLEQWLVESRTLVDEDPDAGVLVTQTSNGYIYAVSAYLIERNDITPPEMSLPFVAYVQWNGSAAPFTELLDQLANTALRRGCLAIVTDGRPVATGNDTIRWEQHGFRWSEGRLRRNLANPGGNTDRGLAALYRQGSR